MTVRSDYQVRVDRLTVAAREKSADKVAAANRAITKLTSSGASVTFASIAREAGVSTDFLYRNAPLRERISELRTSPTRSAAPLLERPSGASQIVQIAALKKSVTELRHQRDELRRENEVLRGELLTLKRRSAG
jgi:hypothetical protein